MLQPPCSSVPSRLKYGGIQSGGIMPTTRTLTFTVYKFDELSEQAQEKALERLWDLNVDHDWWEHVYEDAERIGIKITGFDLDRNTVKGHLTENLLEAFKLVRQNYDKDCEIFKTAKHHLNKYIQTFIQWYDRESKQDDAPSHWNRVTWLREFAYEDEADELIGDYLLSIFEDYLIILRKEYEYLTSREQITKSIKAIEYEFNEDGTLA